MNRAKQWVVRGMALALTIVLSVPAFAADAATGSAVGRVTVLQKGMPSPADASWKVRFTSQAGGGEPIEVPLRNGVYETPELPVGPYQVQVVNAFGQPIGDPQTLVLREGAVRLDLRLELTKTEADKGGAAKSRWKVVAIVGGAAAALALASGGGGDDGPPASPVD